MTNDSVSPPRQRMIEDMNLRKLSAGTQRAHIRSCRRFAAFLKRSPDTATAEDIRRFQLHLAETGISIGRPPQRVARPAIPASENLHRSGHRCTAANQSLPLIRSPRRRGRVE